MFQSEIYHGLDGVCSLTTQKLEKSAPVIQELWMWLRCSPIAATLVVAVFLCSCISAALMELVVPHQLIGGRPESLDIVGEGNESIGRCIVIKV